MTHSDTQLERRLTSDAATFRRAAPPQLAARTIEAITDGDAHKVDASRRAASVAVPRWRWQPMLVAASIVIVLTAATLVAGPSRVMNTTGDRADSSTQSTIAVETSGSSDQRSGFSLASSTFARATLRGEARAMLNDVSTIIERITGRTPRIVRRSAQSGGA